MSIAGPWRRIVKREYCTGHYGCNIGAGGYVLHLACGHDRYVKASSAPKRRSRCFQCRDNGER